MSRPLGLLVAAKTPFKLNFEGKPGKCARVERSIRFFVFFLNGHFKHSTALLVAILGCIVFYDYSAAQPGPVLMPAAAPEPAAEATRLIVNEPLLQKKGLAVPLGVTVKNSVEGGLVVIGGLVKGTKLSAGHAVGDKNWYLFATDLNNVMIQPPPDFSGTMEVSIELLLADTAVVDRHTIRFQWEEPQTAVIARPAGKKELTLKLPPEEIESMLKRGENLIATGDITAARLVLTQPAEAGDARAAYALAKTYDRVVLDQLHAYGLSPDPALAQHWYEKAKQLGVTDRTALGRSTSNPD